MGTSHGACGRRRTARRPFGSARADGDRRCDPSGARVERIRATFEARGQVADAVRDAVAWLQQQPPAQREVVIVGDLRRGAITSGDLALAPAPVGIRFELTAIAPTSGATSMAAVADNGEGGTQGFELSVTPGDRATEVAYRPASVSTEWLTVQAPASEARHAEALRAATLAEGLVSDRPQERRVTVVFPGEGMWRAADLARPAAASWMHDAIGRLDGLAAGERQGQFVALADVSATDPAAIDLVARVARIALTVSRAGLEPLSIAPERLAAWSRPPGLDDQPAPPRDEGDRRWLWAAALALLVVEQLVRQSRRAPLSSDTTSIDRRGARCLSEAPPRIAQNATAFRAALETHQRRLRLASVASALLAGVGRRFARRRAARVGTARPTERGSGCYRHCGHRHGDARVAMVEEVAAGASGARRRSIAVARQPRGHCRSDSRGTHSLRSRDARGRDLSPGLGSFGSMLAGTGRTDGASSGGDCRCARRLCRASVQCACLDADSHARSGVSDGFDEL